MARSAKAERERLRETWIKAGKSMTEVAGLMGQHFGVRPRTAWRYAAGWDQWKLVQQYRTANPDARIDESRISRWESWPFGGSRPSLEALAGLALTLGHGCTLADLVDDTDRQHLSAAEKAVITATSAPGSKGMIVSDSRSTTTSPAQEGENEVHRREMLRLLSVVSAAVLLPAGPQSVAAAAPIGEFSRFNTHLWQVYALTPAKADVLPLVRRQLAVLSNGLNRSPGPADRQQLCALAGDLFQLAGEIYFDADAYTDAAHCYHLAAQASREAGAHDQWACALTRHAYLSVYEKKFTDALPVLELAAAVAARGDSELSTRHWVSAVQGEVYAGLSDLNACRHALDHAQEVAGLTSTIHNGGWLRFDGSRLPEERGTCYVTLGRPDLAETALTEALQHATSTRRRNSVLADLAIVGAQRRDLDQVLVHADAALAHAQGSSSAMITRKLLTLRPHLAPLMSDPRARELADRLTALTAA
ncbi:hypothetical protein [Promicromonospora umidemergens]|uniref:hypothetical protein n=1 Tax=Promicromonospora umidemergens TaxID=629679 RepID=UPI0020A4DBFC|nr:hypothetical protein [Promicromonospora umidemergens]